MSYCEKRNIYLDVIKGIGIFLVVLAHVSRHSITGVIYSFHMPLFFIISGYIYGKYNKIESCRLFIQRKISSLLVPYFVLGGGLWLYWTLIERGIRNQLDINPVSVLLNLFIGQGTEAGYAQDVVLWFLIDLFLIQCIFHILYISYRKFLPLVIILFAVFSYTYSIALNANDNLIRLPWTLDIAGISLLFYSIGFLYSKKAFSVNLNYIKALMVFLLLCAVTAAISCVNGGANMLDSKYHNFILFFIAALSGTCCCLLFGYMIRPFDTISRIFAYLGINSLLIMCIHEPIKRIVIKIFDIILNNHIPDVRTVFPIAVVMSVLTILVCMPIISIIKKYFPFISGNKK